MYQSSNLVAPNLWHCSSSNVGFGPTPCVCTDSDSLAYDEEIQTVAKAAISSSKFDQNLGLIRVSWATKVVKLGKAQYHLDLILGLTTESGPQRQCNFVISQVTSDLAVDPQFVKSNCNTGIQYLGFFIPPTLVASAYFLVCCLHRCFIIFCHHCRSSNQSSAVKLPANLIPLVPIA